MLRGLNTRDSKFVQGKITVCLGSFIQDPVRELSVALTCNPTGYGQICLKRQQPIQRSLLIGLAISFNQ